MVSAVLVEVVPARSCCMIYDESERMAKQVCMELLDAEDQGETLFPAVSSFSELLKGYERHTPLASLSRQENE